MAHNERHGRRNANRRKAVALAQRPPSSLTPEDVAFLAKAIALGIIRAEGS